MGIINHKFHVTFTHNEDAYPSTDYETNFTDSSSDSDTKEHHYIAPGAGPDWHDDVPELVFDASPAIPGVAPNGRRAKYLYIEVSQPCYLWFENDPTSSPITSEPIRVERMMMVEAPAGGGAQKIWAVNPSRSQDPAPTTMNIKIFATLMNLPF